MPTKEALRKHRQSLVSFSEEFSAEEVVHWAVQAFGDGLVLQTSAGIQAAVMIKLVSSIKPDVKVVFVDTGYLPKETTDYMETLRREYSLNLTIARPKLTPAEIETQYGKLWETDHELYGEITKVEPMSRALSELGCTAILSGLRSQQTSNREALQKLSCDMSTHRFKVLPILEWTKADVKTYQKEMKTPPHPLEAAGYTTIGDAHSSRAKKEGEDDRATRFGGKSQECGLHTRTKSLLDILGSLEELHALPMGYVLYTKPKCKYCKAAKALLQEKGIEYLEKDVSQDELAAEMYTHAPDAQTVPQIFLDNGHVGGFADLFEKLAMPGTPEHFVTSKVDVQEPEPEPKVMDNSYRVFFHNGRKVDSAKMVVSSQEASVPPIENQRPMRKMASKQAHSHDDKSDLPGPVENDGRMMDLISPQLVGGLLMLATLWTWTSISPPRVSSPSYARLQ